MPPPQQDDPLNPDLDLDEDIDRQPLDPFPTLLSSLRTHIAQPATPTYAAIARSPSNSNRPTLAPEGSGSAGPSNGNTNGYTRAWSADDVDRDDRLDEIRSFPSSPVVFRVPSPPPARPVAGLSTSAAAIAGPSTSIEAGIDALPDPTQRNSAPIATPASQTRPLEASTSVYNGPIRLRPRRDDNTRETAAETDRRRRIRTVAPDPASDPIGEAMELAFGGTWNEGMVAAARHLTQPIDTTAIAPAANSDSNSRTVPLRRRGPHTSAPTRPGPTDSGPSTTAPLRNLRSLDERVAELDRMRDELRQMQERGREDENVRARFMIRAQERLNAIGEAAAATTRRTTVQHVQRVQDNPYAETEDEDEDDLNEFAIDIPIQTAGGLGDDWRSSDDGTGGIETEAEWRERALLGRMRREAEAIANAATDLDSPRRQRLRTVFQDIPALPVPTASRTLNIAPNLPRGTAVAAAGPGPRATGRVIQPFYAHPNLTGDIDIDAWETAFGDDPPPLRRGGNNRRRGTSSRPHGSLPPVHGATETRDITPLRRQFGGLLPTNRYSYAVHSPDIALVTSRRRDRVEETISRAISPHGHKKRKVDEPSGTATVPKSKVMSQCDWPTYLKHNSYTKTDHSFLPLQFESTDETFLKVTPSSIGRPIIQFVDHPQLSSTDADASNIGTTRAIPVALGVFYYEVECIDSGEEGYMSVGWKLGGIRKNRLIGWDKGTFGWHSDDGMCFEQSGSGSDFAAKWGPGDTVGLGIDFTTGRAFFTKNGILIGNRFKNLGAGLHPAIGLRSQGEELCINFNGPFRFDIDSHVGKIMDKVNTEISELEVFHIPRLSPAPWRSRGHIAEERWLAMCEPGDEKLEPMHRVGWDDQLIEPTLPELPATSALRGAVECTTAAFVLDFLKHRGHTSALESTRQEMVRRNWLSKPDETMVVDESSTPNILDKINEVNRHILDFSGPIPIDLIKELIPDTNLDLFHRLQVLQLLHLIRRSHATDEDDMEEAIAYGKSIRASSLRTSSQWGDYEMGYFDRVAGHITCPLNEIQITIWDRHRRRLAAELDKHLRSVNGLASESLLERSIKQVGGINKVMAEFDPSTAFVDINRLTGLNGVS